MTERKSTLLLVVGILLIIGAAFNIITLLIGGVFVALVSYGGLPGYGMLVLSVVIAFAVVVLQLISGIMGVVNYKKPEKAQTCMIFGILILVVVAINIIFSLVANLGVNIFQQLLGFLLPILYIIGANQLKAMAAEPGPTPPQDFVE